MKSRLLVVDDEQGIRQSLTSILQDEGWAAQAVAGGEDCLRALAAERFHLVLLDVWLKDSDGLDILRRIR